MTQKETCGSSIPLSSTISSTSTMANNTLTATLHAMAIQKTSNNSCSGLDPEPDFEGSSIPDTIPNTIDPALFSTFFTTPPSTTVNTPTTTNVPKTSISATNVASVSCCTMSNPLSETEESEDALEEYSTAATTPTTIPTTPTKSTISPPLTISTNLIRLDITSDTTCPWCFVTKRRIARAIRIFHSLSFEASKVRFDIHWHPYQLDPQAPQNPTSKMILYTRKYGSDQGNLVKSRIRKAGETEGINFRGPDGALYCNTLNSHRLIRYAREKMARKLFGNRHEYYYSRDEEEEEDNDADGEQQDQNANQSVPNSDHDQSEDNEEDDDEIDVLGNLLEDAMVEELFISHFVRGECGDLPTLQKIAHKVLIASTTMLKDSRRNHRIINITGSEEEYMEELEQELINVENFLSTDEYLDDVKEEMRIAKKELGIQGVPAIIVQNTYLISGGQDPSTFVQLFKRVV